LLPDFAMRAVLITNNPVLLDYAGALLRDAGIAAHLFDDSMSIMDGSLGMLPRRLMVSEDDVERARAVLNAGLDKKMPEP
jgi:hypothetical protein